MMGMLFSNNLFLSWVGQGFNIHNTILRCIKLRLKQTNEHSLYHILSAHSQNIIKAMKIMTQSPDTMRVL